MLGVGHAGPAFSSALSGCSVRGDVRRADGGVRGERGGDEESREGERRLDDFENDSKLPK